MGRIVINKYFDAIFLGLIGISLIIGIAIYNPEDTITEPKTDTLQIDTLIQLKTDTLSIDSLK